MKTVYAILSELSGDIYVGIAKDSGRRLKEHNAGKIDIRKVCAHGKQFMKKLNQIGLKQERERNT